MKKKVIDKAKFEELLENKGLLTEGIKQVIADTSTDYSSNNSKNSTPEKDAKHIEEKKDLIDKPSQLNPKSFSISGSIFYDEVKNWILAKENAMQKFSEEFSYLSSEIKNVNDLYSLTLQEAIKHKDLNMCEMLLNSYHEYILTNTDQQSHNAIFAAIHSKDSRVMSIITEYIVKHQDALKNEHALLSENKNLLQDLTDEFTFYVSTEDHDYFYQNFLLPLYGDVNDCMNFS